MGDLSAHFDRSEFACKCGCGLDTVDAKLLEFAEMIRQHFDAAVHINSGCRCLQHNRVVGGSANSQHVLCRAMDIEVEGVPPKEVADYAQKIRVGGLGRYEGFTHVDSRTGHARWSGR